MLDARFLATFGESTLISIVMSQSMAPKPKTGPPKDFRFMFNAATGQPGTERFEFHVETNPEAAPVGTNVALTTDINFNRVE